MDNMSGLLIVGIVFLIIVSIPFVDYMIKSIIILIWDAFILHLYSKLQFNINIRDVKFRRKTIDNLYIISVRYGFRDIEFITDLKDIGLCKFKYLKFKRFIGGVLETSNYNKLDVKTIKIFNNIINNKNTLSKDDIVEVSTFIYNNRLKNEHLLEIIKLSDFVKLCVEKSNIITYFSEKDINNILTNKIMDYSYSIKY